MHISYEVLLPECIEGEKRSGNLVPHTLYVTVKLSDIDGRIHIDYEFDNKVHHLGTEEVNGYLFRVSFQNNNIYISMSHAIADGRGAVLFGCSLIYEYLKLMGIKITSSDEIITNETPISETEMDTFTSNELEKSKNYSYEEPFVLPTNYQFFNTEYEKKTVLSWNAENFSNFIHQLECTPVAFITTIIGNAIYKNYDVKEKKVFVSIPVDLRPFYQSKAQANFFTGIKLQSMCP